MGQILKSVDAISGSRGRAYMKLDGNNEELFFAKKIESKLAKEKGEIKSIGRKMVGHKGGLLNGTGSMTIYYVTPLLRRAVQDYKNGGPDLYFDMVVENDDPSSAAGKQTVLLVGVNLDGTDLAKLDAEATELEEDVDFTFEDYEILNEFNKI